MRICAAFLLMSGLVLSAGAANAAFKVVYKDGIGVGALKQARDGNFYGPGFTHPHNSIVRLTRDGVLSIVYTFKGGEDGDGPNTRLIEDADGNFYGTTQNGGGTGCDGFGCGVIFKLAPGGTETVLHRFQQGPEGTNAIGHLERDKFGNLYGITLQGGDVEACNGFGCGVVFKLAPDGTWTVLHAFTGGADGADARAVVLDKKGDLYGTAYSGGTVCQAAFPLGCGLIWKVAKNGTFSVLHAFTGGDGERSPYGIRLDRDGNLYGVNSFDGDDTGAINAHVFKLTPEGAYSVIGGGYGVADALYDKQGRLYVTTAAGGDTRCNCGQILMGVTALHVFGRGGARSQFPITPMTLGDDGWIWGTTAFGGHGNHGVVYKAKP
jgi:uncharacterized repeat protein (TIGR03803 family)